MHVVGNINFKLQENYKREHFHYPDKDYFINVGIPCNANNN